MSTVAAPPAPPEAQEDDSKNEVSPAPAQPAAEDKDSTREYIVFVEAQPDVYKKLKVVTATSADNAIKSLGEDELKSGQKYAATTVRGWKTVQVTIEQTTSLKFS